MAQYLAGGILQANDECLGVDKPSYFVVCTSDFGGVFFFCLAPTNSDKLDMSLSLGPVPPRKMEPLMDNCFVRISILRPFNSITNPVT